MRRLGLLTPLFLLACAKDNPAFDDCETDAACVDETRGDGDLGDGDGDPGDGDPGDGDPGDGDGDGDEGDGDGDPGDGDGDGDAALPTCPDSMWVSMPVEEDTFLDGSSADGAGCIIDWDFNGNQPVFGNGLCAGLDFGASPGHWACSEGSCNSVWLGRFDLSEWKQLPVQVLEAGFAFTATYTNDSPNGVLAYELAPNNVNFGECMTWHAGTGQGEPPSECATTYTHSAFPNLWPATPDNQLLQAVPIAAANLPATGDEFAVHSFVMPVDPTWVQAWFTGQAEHHGILVSSGGSAPTDLYLFAQGSNTAPELRARLCLP